MKTPLHSILLVLFASVLGSFGAALLKSGASRLHREWQTVLFNGRLAGGCALYGLSFVVYTYGVREGELSILYPMLALGYIWTLFWSRLFFAEPITRRKLAGLGTILAGIIILNLGNR